MLTLHTYKIVATAAILIPLVKYFFTIALKKPKPDDDWMVRDTRKKALMIAIFIIGGFPGMVIGMITSGVYNYYFNWEFAVTMIALAITIIFTLIDIFLRKYISNKYINGFIHLIRLIVPIVVFIWAYVHKCQ